ncbi:MAG: tetratricopeptide repeat protein, partial [Candidatus Latescibacterota bacterium]
NSSISEALRIIATEVPARPSSATGPGARKDRLKGDLDNIVLKSLEKNPNDRYSSVEALATDIRRHLDGLPIEAREASAGYRIRKFVARHRWGVSVSVAIMVLLLGFAVAIAIQQSQTAAARDLAQQEAARAERTVEFLMGLFEASDPAQALGDSVTALQLLERGVEQAEALSGSPLLQAETYDVIGQVYGSLGRNEEAVELLRRSVDLRRATPAASLLDLASSLRDLSQVLADLRRNDEAVDAASEALSLAERSTTPPSREIARGLNSAGLAASAAGDYATADSMLKLAYAQAVSVLGPEDDETIGILINRMIVLQRMDSFEDAEEVGVQVLEWARRNLPENHPRLAEALTNQAVSLRNQGKYEQARPLYDEALAIKRKIYGDAHPSTATSVLNMAIFYGVQGDYGKAEPYFEEAIDLYTAAFGPESPRTAAALAASATLYGRLGRSDEAAVQYRRALATQEKTLGVNHDETIRTRHNLGLTLVRAGKFEEGIVELKEAVRRYGNTYGESGAHYLRMLGGLAMSELRAGKLAEARNHAQESVAIAHRNPELDERVKVETMSDLGRVLVDAEEYRQADSVLTEVLRWFHANGLSKETEVLLAKDALGRARMHLGQYASSDSLLREVYRIRHERLGPDQNWTRETRQALVELYDLWNKPLPAELATQE